MTSHSGTRLPEKLTIPETAGAIPRTPLFDRLGQAANRNAMVWITAPAGAGKTMLLAGFAQHSGTPALWFRIDAGDCDPASFFHYLGLAARRLSPGQAEFPALTAEYAFGIDVFARNFFREIGARLRGPSLLVLDSYEELPADNPLHRFLAAGLEELPAGVSVLVASRSEPPDTFARLRTAGRLVMIGPEEMQLSIEETAALAQLHYGGIVPDQLPERLYHLARGWAAGTTLLLQDATPISSWPLPEGAAMPSVLFDYFASQVMRKFDSLTRELLLSTALLPQVTSASAAALCGTREAGNLLRELAQRPFFIARHPGDPVRYEYHPLFRNFLLRELERRSTGPELDHLRRKAAALLVASDEQEGAVALLREARDWHALAEIVITQAPVLLAQGRSITLESSIDAVPEAVRDERPWLLFWSACARLAFDPVEARARFERGFRRFEATGEIAGCYLAWAGIIDSFILQWDDCTGMVHWLDEYRALRALHPAPSPEVETRSTAAYFGALFYAQPGHPDLAQLYPRMRALLESPVDADFRARLAMTLALCSGWFGDMETSRAILGTARLLAERPAASPLTLAAPLFIVMAQSWLTADFAGSEEWVREGRRLAERTGVHVIDSNLQAQWVLICGARGKLAEMGHALEAMRATLMPNRRFDAAHYHLHRGWYASLQGDFTAACAEQEKSLALAERLAAPLPATLGRLALAQVLALAGAFTDAERHLAHVLEFARGASLRWPKFTACITLAYVRVMQARTDEALSLLRETFEEAWAGGFIPVPLWGDARIARPLCAAALRHGVAPELAHHWIRKMNIRPGPDECDIDAWPRPIRVRALGELSITRGGEPIRFAGKAQKKPLELLAALIAFGGRNVADARLADALWPQAEGHRARQNLKAALHRLRRLLGAEVITVTNGGFSLDPGEVWVDVSAFQRLADRTEKELTAMPPSRLAEVMHTVFDLYRGDLLAQESGAAWPLALREQLRARFTRLLEALGAAQLRAGASEAARTCYERGLDIDPRAEVFYQGLMRCYCALGRPAEALAAFQRCETVLRAEVGVGSSPETVQMAAALRSG